MDLASYPTGWWREPSGLFPLMSFSAFHWSGSLLNISWLICFSALRSPTLVLPLKPSSVFLATLVLPLQLVVFIKYWWQRVWAEEFLHDIIRGSQSSCPRSGSSVRAPHVHLQLNVLPLTHWRARKCMKDTKPVQENEVRVTVHSNICPYTWGFYIIVHRGAECESCLKMFDLLLQHHLHCRRWVRLQFQPPRTMLECSWQLFLRLF